MMYNDRIGILLSQNDILHLLTASIQIENWLENGLREECEMTFISATISQFFLTKNGCTADISFHLCLPLAFKASLSKSSAVSWCSRTFSCSLP